MSFIEGQPQNSDNEKKEYPFSVREHGANVAAMLSFREHFRPKADVIYYPSCGTDISPVKAFPESRVIFVDRDSYDVEKMKEAGFEVYLANSKNFIPPAPIDIVFRICDNSNGRKPFEVLQPGGHLFCDNMHRTADLAKKQGDLLLVGVTGENKKILTENLEEYLTYVESDEELLKYKGTVWDSTVESIIEIVKEVTGQATNVVAEYRKLLDGLEKRGSTGGGIMTLNDRPRILSDLPRKRYTSFYIFRKEKIQP